MVREEFYTEEEHEQVLLMRRHKALDERDGYLEALSNYLKENPNVLPEKKGDLSVSARLVDLGEEIKVKVICYGSSNATLVVTKNCFGHKALPEPYLLKLEKVGEDYCQEITMKMDVPGNTKIEFWANQERLVRQIAVVEKGYMAVIPWIGANHPVIDEEIHRYDIPGDYWVDGSVHENPRITVDNHMVFLKNSRKFGDRPVCRINARSIIADADTDCLFELDAESQERGIRQIDKQMRVLGYGSMELIASYTPDAVAVGIFEKLGIKGLTSLCAWQNWQDGGWKINHCGVSNQPYYPAVDDFRRAGDKRKIMCFTMGNSSCDRNYSIMAYDACPSNVVPGERYFDHRVLHYSAQRFYDTFDGYVADAKNNDDLMTVTIAIESFRGYMDWAAVNDMAIKHMVKRAATEKIVFTSAADVSDYHQRKDLDMQEAYFFQPDYYYGFHNGEMPGRIADRIEAVTRDYLAVVRRGSSLPMYFYDYSKSWESPPFEDVERNEFGLVNPDIHASSESNPKQIYMEDMTVDTEIKGNEIVIRISSATRKERFVTGVFDVPFESDFFAVADKSDVMLKKVTDQWTGNTHLFVDMGSVESGDSRVVIAVNGTPREPVAAECIKDKLAVMWYGDHAYMRCLDKDDAICVEMKAPEGAYLVLQSGERVFPEEGKFSFIVNEEWYNEAPMLFGCKRAAFTEAMQEAKVEKIGPTRCSRWSW